MNQQTNNTNKRTQPPVMYSNSYKPAYNSGTSSSGYSGSRVLGIVILVVVLLLLAGACYWLYSVYSNRVFQTTVETEVMPEVKDAATNFGVGNGSIPSSKYSNEYSISMWLNIDNYTYNYGKEKTILRRGEKGDGNLEIVLDAKTNDLIVRLKLQNNMATNPLVVSSAASTGSNVSKFADIPKLETHVLGNHESANYYYIHRAFADNNLKYATNSLDSMGNNLVNYPTIQYKQSSGCDNALNTMNPDDAMTIMIEQAARMKEGFSHTSNNKDGYDLARVDTSRLSDNSAPLESRNIYHNDYFSAISGNDVQLNGKIAKLKEGFDTVSDLTNACIAVMMDMCKLASTMQSQKNADDDVASINNAFQSLIDSIESVRGNSKTVEDISAALESSLSKMPNMLSSSSNYKPLMDNLITNLLALMAASSQPGAENVSLSDIQTTVNAKLSSANCPLTLSGTSDADITANFFQSFINLLKKSLYTYINNMGVGLQRANPDLAGNSSVSCIIQNITNPDPTIGTCVYRDIPLQKWVHVIVSVYNQVIDIFIDGQLASSCVLKTFPAISTSNVLITPDGGFAGKISRVIFSNTAMTVQHSKQLYYDGPVKTSGLLSMIPNWVWYGIIFLIIISIGMSILM